MKGYLRSWRLERGAGQARLSRGAYSSPRLRRSLSAAICAAVSVLALAPWSHVHAQQSRACHLPIDASPTALRWDQGRHLCYLDALSENFARLSTAPAEDKEIIEGDIAIYLSMIGEDDASRNSIARMFESGLARAAPTLSDGEISARDAVVEIVRRAADHQLVIINEAHHVSRHRDLVRRLLPGLRAAGYTHFAAEALAFDIDVSRATAAPPDESSGFYLRDPAFARLIHEAQRLGFQIVPYEAPPLDTGLGRVDSMQLRERAQAERLYARTFGATPNAKVVALVGYDHVEEAPRRRSDGQGDFLWMAAELKQRAGLDPLTVDQATLNPEATPGLEAPEYRPLLDLLKPPSSVVLFTGAAPWVSRRYQGRVDLQIMHPPSPETRGREVWRWEDMQIVEPELPDADPPDKRYFVQAFLRDTPSAVPLDQVITSRTEMRPLLVPADAEIEIRITPVSDKLADTIDARKRVWE